MPTKRIIIDPILMIFYVYITKTIQKNVAILMQHASLILNKLWQEVTKFHLIYQGKIFLKTFMFHSCPDVTFCHIFIKKGICSLVFLMLTLYCYFYTAFCTKFFTIISHFRTCTYDQWDVNKLIGTS